MQHVQVVGKAEKEVDRKSRGVAWRQEVDNMSRGMGTAEKEVEIKSRGVAWRQEVDNVSRGI